MANKKVIDVTPGNMDENSDLNYGIETSIRAGVQLGISVHFNKTYDSYDGKIGCEVWLNPGNSYAAVVGQRIVNNLASLGFRNRGVKDGYNAKHLAEVRNGRIPWIIVEVCFVEATGDVETYNAVGYDLVGKAIAEGILGVTIGKSGWYLENDNWYYYVENNKSVNAWIEDSHDWCYLGTDGAMIRHGWAKDSHGWYYMGGDGYPMKNIWIYWKDKAYYMGSDGMMLTNCETPDGYTVLEDGSWNGIRLEGEVI